MTSCPYTILFDLSSMITPLLTSLRINPLRYSFEKMNHFYNYNVFLLTAASFSWKNQCFKITFNPSFSLFYHPFKISWTVAIHQTLTWYSIAIFHFHRKLCRLLNLQSTTCPSHSPFFIPQFFTLLHFLFLFFFLHKKCSFNIFRSFLQAQSSFSCF